MSRQRFVSNQITCRCGDVFPTEQAMFEHLSMIHGCTIREEVDSRHHPQALRALIEKLNGYPRKLRIDASGEDGRMPATEMYALADLLDELASLLPAPQQEGK